MYAINLADANFSLILCRGLALLMYPLSEARNLASAGSPRVGCVLKKKTMAYAQIRVRRLNNSNLASTEKHNARLFSPDDMPDNIDTSQSRENQMMFCRSEWAEEKLSMQEMVERRLKELNVKGIKKNSTKAIEVVVSVSDPNFFTASGGYSPLGYGSNEMKWLEDTYFGHDNIVCGYLHMDESKPHWHFICIPAKEKEVAYKNRYGSGKKIEMRLCANDIIHGYNEEGVHKLSDMQQKYYEHCQERYGHIVPFWRGLLAEEQRRKYIERTDADIARYKKEQEWAAARNAAALAQAKIQYYDSVIERQDKSRQKDSYQWDKGSEVPEWSWGKRGR